jgi:hypothetical protein
LAASLEKSPRGCCVPTCEFSMFGVLFSLE